MSNIAKIAGQAANTLVKPLNVEDVFSTYLYTGNSSTQTITNGIDLDGEGGLVWIKAREQARFHSLNDTERGAGIRLDASATSAEQDVSTSGVTSFTSTGFTLGFNTIENENDWGIVSWTFRKAPKFFDVVTYTGDGVAGRTVSHNLGVEPGCIIVKKYAGTGGGEPWEVYHRGVDSSAPEDYRLVLNSTVERLGGSTRWNGTAPTSTEFTLGTESSVNGSGISYVAYLFAHNDGDGEFGPDGDADIIKCGSYTGNGSSDGPEIDLGFEPQWLLVKNVSASANWRLVDTMRGFDYSDARSLYPNLSAAEGNFNAPVIVPTPTGFKLVYAGLTDFNASGNTYIYIAIRRGPMAVPESADEVFAVDEGDGVGAVSAYTSGFPVDFAIDRTATSASPNYVATRLLQGTRLQTDGTNAEASESAYYFDYMEGWRKFARAAGNYSWMWKRAPNFFDVVAYTGQSEAQVVNHNLGVVPEMIWIKKRSESSYFPGFAVYHGTTGNMQTGNTFSSGYGSSNAVNHSTISNTTFQLANGNIDVNDAGETHIAYLFASLDGVSKVGSYTGTGSQLNIDCGFTAGARFVIIKRYDAAEDWFVFDTTRGIETGNDPYLQLNTTNAETGTADMVDPYSAGFAVTDQSGAVNANGGKYIFYAIA